MTLAGIVGQSLRGFHLIVADQSDSPQDSDPVVKSLLRIIEARGNETEWHNRQQVHGVAEQRDFLLNRAHGDLIVYIDDDVFLEPWVGAMLIETLRDQGCGFVGAFPTGLSFKDDHRPAQETIEFW